MSNELTDSSKSLPSDGVRITILTNAKTTDAIENSESKQDCNGKDFSQQMDTEEKDSAEKVDKNIVSNAVNIDNEIDSSTEKIDTKSAVSTESVPAFVNVKNDANDEVSPDKSQETFTRAPPKRKGSDSGMPVVMKKPLLPNPNSEIRTQIMQPPRKKLQFSIPDWVMQIRPGGNIKFNSPPPAHVVAYCVFKGIRMLFLTGMPRPPKHIVTAIVKELERDFEETIARKQDSHSSWGEEVQPSKGDDSVEEYLHGDLLNEIPAHLKCCKCNDLVVEPVILPKCRHVLCRQKCALPCIQSNNISCPKCLEFNEILNQNIPVSELFAEQVDKVHKRHIEITFLVADANDYHNTEPNELIIPSFLMCSFCSDIVSMPIFLPKCHHAICAEKCLPKIRKNNYFVSCPDKQCDCSYFFKNGNLKVAAEYHKHAVELVEKKKSLMESNSTVIMKVKQKLFPADDMPLNDCAVWPKKLICLKCSNLFVEPVALPQCSHAICKLCLIDIWGEGDSIKCPITECSRIAMISSIDEVKPASLELELEAFCLLNPDDGPIHLMKYPPPVPKWAKEIDSSNKVEFKTTPSANIVAYLLSKSIPMYFMDGIKKPFPCLVRYLLLCYKSSNVDSVHEKKNSDTCPESVIVSKKTTTNEKFSLYELPPVNNSESMTKKIPQMVPTQKGPPRMVSPPAGPPLQSKTPPISPYGPMEASGPPSFSPPPNGPPPFGPPLNGPIPMGPPGNGPPPMGPPGCGPPPIGPPGNGPPPMGPPGSGPHPMGPPGSGPHPMGPPGSGPPMGPPGSGPPMGPPGNGPPQMGPPGSGPPPMGPPGNGPPPMGPPGNGSPSVGPPGCGPPPMGPPGDGPMGPPYGQPPFGPPGGPVMGPPPFGPPNGPPPYGPPPFGPPGMPPHSMPPMGGPPMGYPPMYGQAPYGPQLGFYGYMHNEEQAKAVQKAEQKAAKKKYMKELDKWRQEYEEWFHKNVTKQTSEEVKPNDTPIKETPGRWLPPEETSPASSTSNDYSQAATVTQGFKKYDPAEPTKDIAQWNPPSTTTTTTRKLVDPVELIYKDIKIDFKEDIPRLAIENLPDGVKSSSLKLLLSKHGQVVSCKVGKDKKGTKAVVELQSEEDASRIKQNLNYSEFEGKSLEISKYKVPLPLEGDPQTFLWVGNLPTGTKATDLKSLLEVYGSVSCCKVGYNKKEEMTFAMVTMKTKDEAIKTIKKIDRLAFNGMALIAKRKGEMMTPNS